MSLKRNNFALRVSGFQLSPDESDRYEVYTVNNPATTALGTLFVASAGTAGTASVKPLVVNNKYPDFPRNVNFNIHGTGVGMAGTLTINGFSQFGQAQSEALGFGSADNGGTVVGSKIFGQFTGGTVLFGTAIGNGTANIGFEGGTGCLFGLPVKIGATSDVISMTNSIGSGPISVGGGTAIGSLVDSTVHAFRPFSAVVASSYYTVWVRSTYNGENEGPLANGSQAS